MLEQVLSEQDTSSGMVDTRTVVGFVAGREQFRRAITALLDAGFVRADIDLMASDRVIEGDLAGIYERPGHLQRVSPRETFVTTEDETALRALAVGTLSSLGALGAVSMVVASGGALALAVGAALVAGAIAGGLGAKITEKVTGAFESELRGYLENGAIALFVRARTEADERRAQELLKSVKAMGVQVQRVELEQHLEHTPLADVVPDASTSEPPEGHVLGAASRQDEQVRRVN